MTQHFYCLHLYTSGIWSFQLTYLMKSILWCQWNDHSTFVYNGNPFLNYVQYEIDVRPVNMWNWAISCHVVPLKVNLQMANFVEDSDFYTLVIWSWKPFDDIFWCDNISLYINNTQYSCACIIDVISSMWSNHW